MVARIWELTDKVLVLLLPNCSINGVGSTILIEGPVALLRHSLRGEAAGLLSTLKKMQEHYNGHAQLMILTDWLMKLLIVSKWGHSDVWPDPGDVTDVVHFDMIFPLSKNNFEDGHRK